MRILMLTDDVFQLDRRIVHEAAPLAGSACRVVLDAHELFDEQRDSIRSAAARRYWRRLGDQLLPRADAVLTVTPRIAHELQRRHRLPKPPTVIYNACPRSPPPRRAALL